jgi:flagellar capping protein FliD
MATTTTPKAAPAKKAAAAKSHAKQAAAETAESTKRSVKESADKALNIYLGVIGKTLDMVQDNLESARKQNDKRVKDLEKRGAQLRKELSKRFDKLETPDFDDAVEDVKAQVSKIQDQLEEAVEHVREKLSGGTTGKTDAD